MSMFVLLLAEKLNTKQENKPRNRGLCEVFNRKSHNLKKKNLLYMTAIDT